MGLTSEIYLTKKNIEETSWEEFIKAISNYEGLLRKWTLLITIHNGEIHYFIKTKCSLPSTIHNLNDFFLKPSKNINIGSSNITFPSLFLPNKLIDTIEYFDIKKKETLKYVEITFRKINNNQIFSKIYFYLQKKNTLFKKKIFFQTPATILSLNLENNNRFFCKSVPKYLDIEKILHLLQSDSNSSLLQIDTFPYVQGEFYLKQTTFDFYKHSLILGSSGAGKSKFISLFIHNLYKNIDLRQHYKIILIDPHASLEKDIGGIGKVIDFHSEKDSVNLFHNNPQDIISSTELLLDLFKSLISDQYNSKLERVLRHSIYILLLQNLFEFSTLRKLLLDTEYRTSLLKQNEKNIPTSILEFFLVDFNDLKTKSYNEAISPIISFIDEMEMIPVFNKMSIENSLKDTIQNNFLTIFSLNKTKLGDKSVKTISGLIMQQLLTLIQSYEFPEHIIFIIDEVAVIENPILSKFLSEARKYNLSLVLASQYFNQISSELKDSIFANVINYYLFRVSRTDASLLSNHLPMKIPLNDTAEEKIKMLSELNNRECVIRVSSNGILLPAFKAKTMDFNSIPRIYQPEVQKEESLPNLTTKNFQFQIDNTINLKEILKNQSSSKGGNNYE